MYELQVNLSRRGGHGYVLYLTVPKIKTEVIYD